MTLEYPEFDGARVWPWPEEAPLLVRIQEWAGAPTDEAVEARWREMCIANPRLFDGGILSVVGVEPGHGIVCRRDSYKRLAVQPGGVKTGVEQLSVTGVMMSRGPGGEPCVLLGRRGIQTRIYGGMWELGPSGGVDLPEPGRAELGVTDLVAQLEREVIEEAGEWARPVGARAVAVCHDPVANSYDVVFACDVPRAERGDAAGRAGECWEYEESLWVPTDRVREFDRDHAKDIIAPTRALFRFLRWA